MGDNLNRALEVGVIGGGYAGMAAAVALADAGCKPTVMEAADTLGGRARRIEWHGHRLDNGQHLLLGAYRHTLALHAHVGGTPSSFHRRPFSLHVDQFRLDSFPLPAPLNLGAGLLVARGLRWRDRWDIMRFTAQVLRGPLPSERETVRAMFARTRQSDRVVSVIWRPLCLAALNTPPEEASAVLFTNVLRATLASRSDSDFIVPREDLSAFLPERGGAYVTARGGEIIMRSRVRSLHFDDNHVETRGDSTRRFDFVICATAPHQAERLLRPHPRFNDTARLIRGLRMQSIMTLYLKFDAPIVLEAPIVGATTGYDWLFDRAWSHGCDGLFAVVMSGANDRARIPHETLLNAVLGNLEKRVTLPKLLWAKMIRERHATFAAHAGVRRPTTVTGYPRLVLAGDYLDSPYPATLESAVMSGLEAAQRIMAEARGNPAC